MPRTDLRLLKSRLYNQPHMITRLKLDDIAAVLESADPQLAAEYPGSGKLAVEKIQTPHGQICKIKVHGTMVQRSFGLDANSGLCGYEALRQAFDAALEDSGVRGIFMDIDTNGGEVSGAFDLVDHLYEHRGQKPFIAFVNESCYSAGYAIASAAQAIYVPRTGGVGSIGVRTKHVDMSEAEKKAGIKVTEIVAGERKDFGSPHKPLSTEAEAKLQSIVDDTYDIFVSTTARNRGMDEKAVRGTKADIFIGKAAVVHDLADAVMTADQAMDELITRMRRNSMNTTASGTQAAAADLTTDGSGGGNDEALNADVPSTEQADDLPAIEAAAEPAPEADEPAPEPTAEAEEEAQDEPAPAEPEQEAEEEPTPDDAGDEAEEEPEPELEAAAEAEVPAASASQFARSDASQIIRACEKAGVPSAAATYIDEGLSIEDVHARLAPAETIRGLCAAANLPGRAEGYIRGGLSVQEVRAKLFDVVAHVEDEPINNHQSPTPSASARISVGGIYEKRRQKMLKRG